MQNYVYVMHCWPSVAGSAAKFLWNANFAFYIFLRNSANIFIKQNKHLIPANLCRWDLSVHSQFDVLESNCRGVNKYPHWGVSRRTIIQLKTAVQCDKNVSKIFAITCLRSSSVSWRITAKCSERNPVGYTSIGSENLSLEYKMMHAYKWMRRPD